MFCVVRRGVVWVSRNVGLRCGVCFVLSDVVWCGVGV